MCAYECTAGRGQKSGSYPLESEWQSYLFGSENQSQVLWKNRKRTYPLSHDSNPNKTF